MEKNRIESSPISSNEKSGPITFPASPPTTELNSFEKNVRINRLTTTKESSAPQIQPSAHSMQPSEATQPDLISDIRTYVDIAHQGVRSFVRKSPLASVAI